jgi:hypothetical protein
MLFYLLQILIYLMNRINVLATKDVTRKFNCASEFFLVNFLRSKTSLLIPGWSGWSTYVIWTFQVFSIFFNLRSTIWIRNNFSELFSQVFFIYRIYVAFSSPVKLESLTVLCTQILSFIKTGILIILRLATACKIMVHKLWLVLALFSSLALAFL